MRAPKKPKKDNKAVLLQKSATLDRLAEYEEFCDEILPAIRRDLAKGLSVKELREKYIALAEAKKISLALSPSTDGSVALAAIKDLQDRTEGKAVERKVVTRKYEDLPDEQLDAILQSEEQDLKDLIN